MRRLIGRIHRSKSQKATFLRFAGVAVTISLIDIGLLYLLILLGLSPYIGRIFSYVSAMTAGYVLNRYITFHHLETGRALWHSLLRHFSVFAVGGSINYAIFSLILLLGSRMGHEISHSTLLPMLAVWIGGLFGMCVNFFLSKKLVFDD